MHYYVSINEAFRSNVLVANEDIHISFHFLYINYIVVIHKESSCSLRWQGSSINHCNSFNLSYPRSMSMTT